MKLKSLNLGKFLSVIVAAVALSACGSGQPPITGNNVYQQGTNSVGTCYNQYGQPYACNNGTQTNNPNNPWMSTGQQTPIMVQSQIQWTEGNSFKFDLGQVNAGDRVSLYSQYGIYLYQQCVPTGGFSFSWNIGGSPYTPVMGAMLKVNGQLVTTAYGPATVQQAGVLTLEGTAAGVNRSCSGNMQAYFTAVSGMGSAIGVLQR